MHGSKYLWLAAVFNYGNVHRAKIIPCRTKQSSSLCFSSECCTHISVSVLSRSRDSFVIVSHAMSAVTSVFRHDSSGCCFTACIGVISKESARARYSKLCEVLSVFACDIIEVFDVTWRHGTAVRHCV